MVVLRGVRGGVVEEEVGVVVEVVEGVGVGVDWSLLVVLVRVVGGVVGDVEVVVVVVGEAVVEVVMVMVVGEGVVVVVLVVGTKTGDDVDSVGVVVFVSGVMVVVGLCRLADFTIPSQFR